MNDFEVMKYRPKMKFRNELTPKKLKICQFGIDLKVVF